MSTVLPLQITLNRSFGLIVHFLDSAHNIDGYKGQPVIVDTEIMPLYFILQYCSAKIPPSVIYCSHLRLGGRYK